MPEVETTLGKLARVANEEHSAGEKAGRDEVTYSQRSQSSAQEKLDHYRRAGEALNKAKALCKHGEWLPWVKDNLKFTRMTANRYMQFAKCNVNVTFDEQLAAWQRIQGNVDAEDEPEPEEEELEDEPEDGPPEEAEAENRPTVNAGPAVPKPTPTKPPLSSPPNPKPDTNKPDPKKEDCERVPDKTKVPSKELSWDKSLAASARRKTVTKEDVAKISGVNAIDCGKKLSICAQSRGYLVTPLVNGEYRVRRAVHFVWGDSGEVNVNSKAAIKDLLRETEKALLLEASNSSATWSERDRRDYLNKALHLLKSLLA